jgi:SAM-dependent methyltransferase
MASLYDRHDLYDLIAPRNAAMESFYLASARANGPRVLELACGSGRLTVPLAQAGLEVVGIDLSETMLAQARRAAEDAGVSIETHLADMRDVPLDGRTFDTVLITANSIMHLLTAADFEGFFRSVARHLAPAGQLLFDCFVPSVALLSRPGIRQKMTTVIHATLGQIAVEEIIDFDPITQVADTTWFWSTVSQRDFHVTRLALRSIFPQELPQLLRANGFELIRRFGDFDGSPLAPGAFRQVCVSAPLSRA